MTILFFCVCNLPWALFWKQTERVAWLWHEGTASSTCKVLQVDFVVILARRQFLDFKRFPDVSYIGRVVCLTSANTNLLYSVNYIADNWPQVEQKGKAIGFVILWEFLLNRIRWLSINRSKINEAFFSSDSYNT